MRKLSWQHGGVSAADAASALSSGGGAGETSKEGFAEKAKTATGGVIRTFTTGGLSTIFGLIVMILEVVIRIIWFLFTVLIPYLVIYFGIPLFILGAILALVFTIGHVFFLIAFFVGVYLYMKGIVKVAFPSFMFNLKSTSSSGGSVSGTKNQVSK